MLLLVSPCLIGQSYQFRGLEWGASREKVKQTEKARFVIEKDNYLQYRSVLGDYDAELYYYFGLSNRLVGSRYVIWNRFTDPQKYFDEYDFFASMLTEKYGKPIKGSVLNPVVVPEDKSLYPALLSKGEFSQETVWETPETTVKLTMTANSDGVMLSIDYLSRQEHQRNLAQKREMLLKDL